MTNKLILIKRSTPNCPQCTIMQSVLEEECVLFETIDIAEKPEAIEKYNVMSVPVILIIDGDSEIRLNGVQPIEVIKELIED